MRSNSILPIAVALSLFTSPITHAAELEQTKVNKNKKTYDTVGKQADTPQAKPVEISPPPLLVKGSLKIDGLEKFWESYWSSFFVENSDVWAAHFTDPCDYQYEKNRKSKRSEISTSRDNLCKRYPDRDYELLVEPEVTPVINDGSKIGYNFSFLYEYKGPGLRASGISRNKLELQWDGDIWLISKFRENIERNPTEETLNKMRAIKSAPKESHSTQKPSSQISSYWDHNGSTMGLLAEGNKRTFIYVNVRDGLEGLVEPGMRLFDGESSGAIYSGKARRFAKGLPAIEYDVEGVIVDEGNRIVMNGNSPIRDSMGKIIKTLNEKLVFTYLRTAELEPPQKINIHTSKDNIIESISEAQLEELRSRAESGSPESIVKLGDHYATKLEKRIRTQSNFSNSADKSYLIDLEKKASKWYSKAYDSGADDVVRKLVLLISWHIERNGFLVEGFSYSPAYKFLSSLPIKDHPEVAFGLSVLNELAAENVLDQAPSENKRAMKYEIMAAFLAEQAYKGGGGGYKNLFRLAKFHSVGFGVTQDLSKAEEYYRKGLALLDVEEIDSFARALEDRGSTKHESAKRWAVPISLAFYLGERVEKDEKRSIEILTARGTKSKEVQQWLIMLASKGVPKAAYWLGVALVVGEDIPEATKNNMVKILEDRLQMGDGEAAKSLTLYYHIQAKLPKEAVRTGKIGAMLGDILCQRMMLTRYRYGDLGDGTPKNTLEAYAWALVISARPDYDFEGEDIWDKDSYKELVELLSRSLPDSAKILGQQRAAELAAGIERNLARSKSDESKSEHYGTAFPVSNKGDYITAAHVVDGVNSCILIVDGRKFEANVVTIDRVNDVALLSTGKRSDPIPFSPTSKVSLGESVATLGFPNPTIQGKSVKYTQGTVSALSGLRDDPRLIQISVPVQPGNSGGPLLNERGEVVGMVISRLSDSAAIRSTGAIPQNVNFAIKLNYILPLLKQDLRREVVDGKGSLEGGKETLAKKVAMVLVK